MGGMRAVVWVEIERLSTYCYTCVSAQINLSNISIDRRWTRRKKSEKILGNLPHFLWAHSPTMQQVHMESQFASSQFSNSLSPRMLWRDDVTTNLQLWNDQHILELELLFCPSFKIQGFALTHKNTSSVIKMFCRIDQPLHQLLKCSRKSLSWHLLNSEYFTLKLTENILCFGNKQFCSLTELWHLVILLRINDYLKQNKNFWTNSLKLLQLFHRFAPTNCSWTTYGSINKGEQVFFLLISFIFPDRDGVCSPKFHFRITFAVCSGFHLLFVFPFNDLLFPVIVSFWSGILTKSIWLASKTNLKSKLFIQLSFITLTSLIYHISPFSTRYKILLIPGLP